MNIPKAIKELTGLADDSFKAINATERQALYLGIRALRFCEGYEHMRMKPSQILLPGETEE